MNRDRIDSALRHVDARRRGRVPRAQTAQLSDAEQIIRLSDGSAKFQCRTGRLAGWSVRVWTVTFVNGRIRRDLLESSRSKARVFVQADGGQWTYTFVKGERRAVTAAALERQLGEATYTAPAHGGDAR